MNTSHHTMTDTKRDPSGPMRVDWVHVKWVNDDDPDLSWLGDYTDRPTTPFFIDRREGRLIGPDNKDWACHLSTARRDYYRNFESCNHRQPGLKANWEHCGADYLNGKRRPTPAEETRFGKFAINWRITRRRPLAFWLDLLYTCEDYERREDYGNGWRMQGCSAEATVSYPCGNGSRRLESFQSGGLYGVESDSERDYMEEVEQEQLADLVQHLSYFGISLDLKTADIQRNP